MRSGGDWRFLMSRLLAFGFLCLSSSFAFAESKYLDDRSSPEQVIESLYNAVNRKEFARAWDYFSEPPTNSFDSFVSGYAETASVEVLVGQASEDGAAGTIFFEIPVAIKSTSASGAEKVFAGCYTLAQTNASAQSPPFRGILIKKGELKEAASEYLPDALPKSCGDAPVPSEKDALLQKAKLRFDSEQKDNCRLLEESLKSDMKIESYELKWKADGASAEEPENVTTLFVFPCDLAAYNSTEVYYIHDRRDGLRLLAFAEPTIDYNYADDSLEKLKSWSLKGLGSSNQLVNSGFDEKTKTIFMGSKWRGIADAFSTGTWTFRNGEFVLTDYSVDPTYDGEQTPFDVFKNGLPVAQKSP
jgi:hypothetical protein